MKIEIYNRETKKVIQTKEVSSLKSFMYFWINQCDDKTYGYKVIE